MANFAEKKKEIFGEDQKKRNNSCQLDFNKVFTAIANDVDYTTSVATTKNGEFVVKDIKPVTEFRQKLFGSVLKDAGHDSAEIQEYVNNYQLPLLPAYPIVSEALTEYMSCRPFTFLPKENMKGTIRIETQDECIKEVKSPKTGEVSKRKYSSYNKIKVKSTCPDNLKSDVQ